MAIDTTTLITIGIIFVLIFWVVLMFYWILGKFGLWKWATYRRLRKKFQNLEFGEERIVWCNNAIKRKWSFKDVRRFVKYEPNGSELLYTFLVLDKFNKQEEKNERRLKRYDRPSDNKPKEEVRQSFFKRIFKRESSSS